MLHEWSLIWTSRGEAWIHIWVQQITLEVNKTCIEESLAYLENAKMTRTKKIV